VERLSKAVKRKVYFICNLILVVQNGIKIILNDVIEGTGAVNIRSVP
jgi:hypothetical protein